MVWWQEELNRQCCLAVSSLPSQNSPVLLDTESQRHPICPLLQRMDQLQCQSPFGKESVFLVLKFWDRSLKLCDIWSLSIHFFISSLWTRRLMLSNFENVNWFFQLKYCFNFWGVSQSQIICLSRMHSSRMCTIRCSGRLGGGGMSAWGMGVSA